VVNELSSLIQHLPDYLQKLQNQWSSLQQQLKEQGATGQAMEGIVSSLAATIQQSAPALIVVPVNFLSGIFGLFVDVVIVLMITLFWLLGSRTFKRFVLGLLPLNSKVTWWSPW
jgi:predicted PurR-regulated permease PerM